MGCEETNHIFQYALAWAAAKTGVEIHALGVMSNHYHVVLADVAGRLPDFARELHRTVAKALNAAQGQWENLWSAEVVAPNHLMGTAVGFARKIGNKSGEVLALCKDAIHAGLWESDEAAELAERARFGKCFGLEDTREGLDAFPTKRPAAFKL